MRIAAILVAGLLLAQALTSTIWFESRRRQMLEIPTRVFATRVADAARILSLRPAGARDEAVEALSVPGFRLRFTAKLPPPERSNADLDRVTALLSEVIRLHLGRPAEIVILCAELQDEWSRPAGSWAMMSARDPVVVFRVAIRLAPDQPWLLAMGREDENGADFGRLGTIADYVLRIYLLRIVIVAVLTLIAVRLAMTPLKRMAGAAEALGRDINRPPLDVDGPREVRAAAEAFNAMQARIVSDIEEKTRFLAAVSHDLRSPITRLRLRTEMLPTEALKENFRRNLGEMEELIDATLDFLRTGAERRDGVLVDLDRLVADLAGDLSISGSVIRVKGSAGDAVTGCPQDLRRCVQNIIENALRYAGQADVLLSAGSDHARICVLDDGPGIPDDQLERVLEPFHRIEASRNSASGGVGLGLSIAANIVGAHGGHLRLANRSTGGLEVTIDLPATA
ncbi:ATP-binding protein [Sphingomonas sp. AP4-R1]|uniref:ATP-binding protein n=1 Tax=Sphingomonas sp. AP4-R1 TaxID=2735134 RepID=UPI001C0FE47C|nr:ATP-binding protein [Sphingomonas sp. AP4-R1]